MRNKFPGTCKCGTHVDAQEGEVRKVAGKWVVSCDACSAVATPTRSGFMVFRHYWPDSPRAQSLDDQVRGVFADFPVIYETREEAEACMSRLASGCDLSFCEPGDDIEVFEINADTGVLVSGFDFPPLASATVCSIAA